MKPFNVTLDAATIDSVEMAMFAVQCRHVRGRRHNQRFFRRAGCNGIPVRIIGPDAAHRTPPGAQDPRAKIPVAVVGRNPTLLVGTMVVPLRASESCASTQFTAEPDAFSDQFWPGSRRTQPDPIAGRARSASDAFVTVVVDPFWNVKVRPATVELKL